MNISNDAYTDLLLWANDMIRDNYLKIHAKEFVSDVFAQLSEEGIEYHRGLFIKKMFAYATKLKWKSVQANAARRNFASINVCKKCGESKPSNMFHRYLRQETLQYEVRDICKDCKIKDDAAGKKEKILNSFNKGILKKCKKCMVEYELGYEHFYTSDFNKCKHCILSERKENRKEARIKRGLPPTIIKKEKIKVIKVKKEQCAICGVNSRRKNDTYCRECRNLVTREYSKDYSNVRVTEYARRQREDIGDYYVKEVLRQQGFKTKEIMPELIELKREQIKLHRLTKQ